MPLILPPGNNALATIRSLAARGDDMSEVVMALLNNTYFIEMTAAAEAGNAIVVTGQIKDQDGQAVQGVKNVLLTSRAPTGTGFLSDGGDGAVVAGSGSVSCWMTTTAAGRFQVSVANANAEQTLLKAELDGGTTEIIILTFA